MGPTPHRLDDDTIRVYLTCLDDKGRGRPGYVDVSSADPTKIVKVSTQPLLDIGEPGAFDDNGLMLLSLVPVDADTVYMYYAGFELCVNVRYRIFTGLAISRDGGETFGRHSRAPILDRSDTERLFRCGNFAMKERGVFKLWYVAGSDWTEVHGKMMPVYNLRYQESADGVTWSDSGTLSMALTCDDEHGFGRPWVVKRDDGTYQMFYSIRRRSFGAYRLGYAESADGINWVRKDDEMGLDVSPDGIDSDAIMYSAVVSIGAKTYCFYNGNNFGEQGFCVAELVS
ncbi:glycoside hydrolase family protein [Paraburkholderia caledonica]|uniref:hypothetical protein n=1 Tax=Paraburkholderia caledonica TaxID=134536 RepID=UPI0003792392|nr:hypothetical protein [Paraburkholderia caledonica]